MDKLQTEGYGALATGQRESVNSMIVQLALWQEANGATMGEITNTLSALPVAYQTAVLEMMGEQANISEILGALRELDIDVAPTIKVGMEIERGARDALMMRSPKFALQEAMENLAAFAEDVEITVPIVIPEGVMESLTLLMASMEQVGEAAPVMQRVVRTVASSIERIFRSMRERVSGPGGYVTRMIREIIDGFNSLAASYGAVSNFAGSIYAAFDSLINAVVNVMSQLPVRIANEMDEILPAVLHKFLPGGTIYEGFKDLGERMADAFIRGVGTAQGTFTVFFSGSTTPGPSPQAAGMAAAGLGAPAYAMVGAPAGGGGGGMSIFVDTLNIELPGVTDLADVDQLQTALDELSRRGFAFQVGAGGI
jgi:hypothetical protein